LSNETSITEQQINELQQTIGLKNNQIEEVRIRYLFYKERIVSREFFYRQNFHFLWRKRVGSVNFLIFQKLVSSVNRIRSDNEQYQQYNTKMQHHIQELNDQVKIPYSLIFYLILFYSDESIKSN
jgi:hypothetical protein